MNRGSGLWNEIQSRQLFDFVESQVCILVKPSHLLFIDHEEVECEKATVAAGIPSRPVLEHLGVFQEHLQLVFSGRSSHSRSFGGVLQSCTAVLWSEQVFFHVFWFMFLAQNMFDITCLSLLKFSALRRHCRIRCRRALPGHGMIWSLSFQ